MRYTPIDQETLASSRISPAKVQYDVKGENLSADADLYALMRRGRQERSAAFHDAVAAIWQKLSPSAN